MECRVGNFSGGGKGWIYRVFRRHTLSCTCSLGRPYMELLPADGWRMSRREIVSDWTTIRLLELATLVSVANGRSECSKSEANWIRLYRWSVLRVA
jgi:hypothetical protein